MTSPKAAAHDLGCFFRRRGRGGAGLVGAVYIGILGGLLQRTLLHEAHESRKVRLGLIAARKFAAILVGAYLVGELLLYRRW